MVLTAPTALMVPPARRVTGVPPDPPDLPAAVESVLRDLPVLLDPPDRPDLAESVAP